MQFRPIFFLIIISCLTACTGSKEPKAVVLAQVGDKVLTANEVRLNIPEHVFVSDSIAAVNNYREDWIRRQLILQEAERLNFAERNAVQVKLKRLQEDFILQSIQDYIIGEFHEDLTVTDEEARNYYQQNKDKFVLDERYVQYRHLVARNRNDAEQARKDLLRGHQWPDVAKEYSLYPELKIRESERFWPLSTAGGDIAMLNRYLQIIGPSEISPIYKSGNQYHFVQLLEEKPKGEHPDLDWLISQIKDWLVLEKRKRAFNTYVKNLYLQGKANNEIKIFTVLPDENVLQNSSVESNL